MEEDYLRASDRDDNDLIYASPLLAYLSPGRYARVAEEQLVPVPERLHEVAALPREDTASGDLGLPSANTPATMTGFLERLALAESPSSEPGSQGEVLDMLAEALAEAGLRRPTASRGQK